MLMEALRDEHVRVHLQDQEALRRINNGMDVETTQHDLQSDMGGISTAEGDPRRRQHYTDAAM